MGGPGRMVRWGGLPVMLVTMLLASAAAAAVEPPAIGRPVPVPTLPSAMGPLPPAIYDPTLQIGGADIKARKIDTRLSVAVTVNERGPFRFIVDSGADTSVIGVGLARQLELPLGTAVTVHGMTASAIVDRVRVGSLRLGDATVRDLQLPALSELDLGAAGIIGLDALVEQRLLLDFDKKLIRVEDGRTPVRALPGEIVVVARRRRGQLIMTGVRAANQRLDAIIDTGSEVTIGNLALRDKLIRKRKATVRPLQMIGVTGAVLNVELGIVSELAIGPILFRDVPVAFVDAPPFALFGVGDQPALLLGTDLMEQFRKVSLDFRSRRVRFQLRRCNREELSISTDPDRSVLLSGIGGNQACRD